MRSHSPSRPEAPTFAPAPRWRARPTLASQSLERQGKLSQLIEASEQSQQMWVAVSHCLPPALRQQTRPSKYSHQVWVWLADSSSVAAKLRHCLPQVQSALFNAGFDVREIRIHLADERAVSTPKVAAAAVISSPQAVPCPPDVREQLKRLAQSD